MKTTTSLSIIAILVEDQEAALRFYIEKLGLEKRADVTYGPGMRWLTVAPKGQRRPEIALARPDVTLQNAATAMPQQSREQTGQIISGIFDNVTFEPLPDNDNGTKLTVTQSPYSDSTIGQVFRQSHLEGWLYFIGRLQNIEP